MPGLKGIEFISPLHVSLEDAVEVKGWLEDSDLEAVSINPYLCGIYNAGVAARRLPTAPVSLRRAAIDVAERGLEIGHVLGCRKMDLLAGRGWL